MDDGWMCHLDLHETTDSDETEYMPARAAAEKGELYTPMQVPDGFFLYVNQARFVQNHRHDCDYQGWCRAILEAVQKVTHLAPADHQGKICGEVVSQDVPSVVLISDEDCVGDGMSVRRATFHATTELYPDSPRLTDEICIQAQVTAITAALDYIITATQSRLEKDPRKQQIRTSNVSFPLPRKLILGLILALTWCCASVDAFVVPPRTAVSTDGITLRNVDSTALHAEDEKGGGFLSFLFNPYESKIPKEIEKEIYEAEGNTPAAQDRGKRIALYATIAFVGILMAFFNGFITELRSTPTPDGNAFSLQEAGFGWVESSFLTRFFFMNKIGGGLLLLTGAGAGLLAEAEYDTRRINAEKIYEELVRRRTARAEKEAPRKKKKRASSKEKKRLAALSEVIDSTNETTIPTEAKQSSEESTPATAESMSEPVAPEPEKKEGGILGTVKNFYQRADSMAASQALLLNKKLEDSGVLEKITDESGLKVVGKQSDKKESSESTDEEPKSKQ